MHPLNIARQDAAEMSKQWGFYSHHKSSSLRLAKTKTTHVFRDDLDSGIVDRAKNLPIYRIGYDELLAA